MFFLTNRSVIFCVIHVRHCELFGSLLSLAISEPRLCCSETLLHCKSPQLYSELSHLYFYVVFLKRYIGHTYIDLFTEICLLRNPRFSDKHVYRHVCQDDQMTDTVQHDTTDWL